MADAHYKISVREDGKYLGVMVYEPVSPTNPSIIWALKVGEVDDLQGTDWLVRDIPGTSSKLLMKRGGSADGQVVTWVGGGEYDLMPLRDYVPGDQEQVVMFDELDGGFVAINNHNKTRVVDRQETKGPRKSAWVIFFPWNGGWNQQWLLRDR